MPLWLLALLGLGGGTATLIAIQKPPRFIGDRAKRGDQALVSADAVKALGPNALPAALANLGFGSIAVRVDDAKEADFVNGPIVGYTLPGQNAGPVQAIVPTAPIHLPRASVTGVLRGGKAA